MTDFTSEHLEVGTLDLVGPGMVPCFKVLPFYAIVFIDVNICLILSARQSIFDVIIIFIIITTIISILILLPKANMFYCYFCVVLTDPLFLITYLLRGHDGNKTAQLF